MKKFALGFTIALFFEPVYCILECLTELAKSALLVEINKNNLKITKIEEIAELTTPRDGLRTEVIGFVADNDNGREEDDC